ncbi:hypothetical protein ILUMI_24131, partial [Ignelater luminosus]
MFSPNTLTTQPLSPRHKKDLVYLAKIAERAGRYDELVQTMNEVVEMGEELSDDERNLLSFAYKTVIGARRSSWKVIQSVEEMTDDSERQKCIVKEYREEIEQELIKLCSDILNLLDEHLLPNVTKPESKTFYLKMKGDYFRYLADVADEELKATLIENSQKAYQNGFEIAKEQLPAIHPIRLALALNYSVFFYHIMGATDKARQLARQSLEEAVSELNKIVKDSYKDSTTIMQLIRENLTQWTSQTK